MRPIRFSIIVGAISDSIQRIKPTTASVIFRPKTHRITTMSESRFWLAYVWTVQFFL
jgi:hypothetical protein